MLRRRRESSRSRSSLIPRPRERSLRGSPTQTTQLYHLTRMRRFSLFKRSSRRSSRVPIPSDWNSGFSHRRMRRFHGRDDGLGGSLEGGGFHDGTFVVRRRRMSLSGRGRRGINRGRDGMIKAGSMFVNTSRAVETGRGRHGANRTVRSRHGGGRRR